MTWETTTQLCVSPSSSACIDQVWRSSYIYFSFESIVIFCVISSCDCSCSSDQKKVNIIIHFIIALHTCPQSIGWYLNLCHILVCHWTVYTFRCLYPLNVRLVQIDGREHHHTLHPRTAHLPTINRVISELMSYPCVPLDCPHFSMLTRTPDFRS